MNADRKSQLKALIALGKEKGYLTYAEVNDYLPDDIVDPDQIEDIVNMINDMGITVHEETPDADTLLMSDNTASTDEAAAEEAAAALAALDSEFGRTTDPVRMYMREMGTVDLLTREGEIKIAKRIEEGLSQVSLSLAQFPGAMALLLGEYESVKAGNARLADIISGFIDPDHLIDHSENTSDPDEKPKPPSAQKAADDDDDNNSNSTGPDPEEAATRFAAFKKLFEKWVRSLTRNGIEHKSTIKAQLAVKDAFLEFKLTPRMFSTLVMYLRSVVGTIRAHERQIMALCVKEAGMPRKDFIKSFPDNEINLKWIDKHIRARKKFSSGLNRHKDEVRHLQEQLIAMQDDTHLTIIEIKEINRQMSLGEAKARRAKKEMVEANLRLVISIAKKYTNRGLQPDESGERWFGSVALEYSVLAFTD